MLIDACSWLHTCMHTDTFLSSWTQTTHTLTPSFLLFAASEMVMQFQIKGKAKGSMFLVCNYVRTHTLHYTHRHTFLPSFLPSSFCLPLVKWSCNPKLMGKAQKQGTMFWSAIMYWKSANAIKPFVADRTMNSSFMLRNWLQPLSNAFVSLLIILYLWHTSHGTLTHHWLQQNLYHHMILNCPHKLLSMFLLMLSLPDTFTLINFNNI